jgi:hypothetical protein
MGVLHMKQSSNIAKNAVTRTLVASNAQIVIGYIMAITCGLIGIIGASTSGLKTPLDVTMVTIFFVLMVLGIWQIVRGQKHKKLIILFKEYAARLATDPLRSVNKLAAATGAAAETVKKNMHKMIHKGYFVNAYIDFERNCLVFSQESSTAQQAESSAEYVRVSCPGCGAKSKIQKGTVGECEFCGSYLSHG